MRQLPLPHRHQLPPAFLQPAIPVPTLVVTGTQDERFPNISKQVSPYVDNKRLFLIEIENAGHFFRDLNIDEAIEALIEFIDYQS